MPNRDLAILLQQGIFLYTYHHLLNLYFINILIAKAENNILEYKVFDFTWIMWATVL